MWVTVSRYILLSLLSYFQTLVEFGHDVCRSNKYGHTPCYYADFSNKRACAGYLMVVEMCRQMAREQAMITREDDGPSGSLHACAKQVRKFYTHHDVILIILREPLTTIYTREIFLQDFLDILKRSFKKFLKTVKICFTGITSLVD